MKEITTEQALLIFDHLGRGETVASVWADYQEMLTYGPEFADTTLEQYLKDTQK